MRKDTPPHSHCDDDDLEARMEFNAMLDAEGILIDDDENGDLEDDFSEDELEEVELEELERRLNEGGGNLVGEVDEDADDGIGKRATPEDKALLTFSGHTSPVFSCHIHPEYDIAVTGGQDDVAYLWNLQDGRVLEKIAEHTDTVTATKFSHDGNFLLTADMGGNICVFRLLMGASGGTEVPSCSNTTNSQVTVNKVFTNSIGDMSWCFWHDRANVLLASSAESGDIYVWRIPSGTLKMLVGAGSCCSAGELTKDGKKLYASYADGSLRLWDIHSSTVMLYINDQHSNELVPSIACAKYDELYVSGDRDGKVLFSTQSGPVQSVKVNGLVECLEFSPSLSLKMLASATLEGETTIWDYTHFTKRVSCAQPDNEQSSICSMKWLSGNSLAVGTADGDILIYDARSGTLTHKLTGHRAHIYEFYYSRRTNMLLSVSEDCEAKLFSIPELDD